MIVMTLLLGSSWWYYSKYRLAKKSNDAIGIEVLYERHTKRISCYYFIYYGLPEKIEKINTVEKKLGTNTRIKFT